MRHPPYICRAHTPVSAGIYSNSIHSLEGLTEDLLTRARELAVYIIENRATIRQAAKHFGLSKSTVHKDLSERLPMANRALYLSVREILDQNRAERHIRGGLATRKKYKGF